MKKFIGYSFFVGALVAIGIYFSGGMNLSDERRNLIEAALSNNVEIRNSIGAFEKFEVKKATKYSGSPNEQPYMKYTLHVKNGEEGVWVRVIINNPNSDEEVVSIIGIEK
ncbi:MAG: hypothetical protein OEW89_01730 [Gammaproteobacteria bacterium]|nr:hypothetical protein [Gammaproteobacteria bacterium]MDH5592943.1 hypothetical protein [Gammaproteobacteria bacterium]